MQSLAQKTLLVTAATLASATYAFVNGTNHDPLTEPAFSFSAAAFCPQQLCANGGGGYYCNGSSNQEFCTNNVSSCTTSMCS